MTDDDFGESSDNEVARAWSDLLHSALAVALPESLSGGSLLDLEQYLRTEVEDPYRLLDPDREESTIALVGYLGRAFLKISGGQWRWRTGSAKLSALWPQVSDGGLHDSLESYSWTCFGAPNGTPGVPVVCPDPVLGLPDLSPLGILVEFLVRDGDANAETAPHQVAQHWGTAVERYQLSNPGWRHAPADVEPSSTGEEELGNWLVAVGDQFPQWSEQNPGTWDFSAASVQALMRLVQSQLPALEDFRNPSHAHFVDGAVWYLGEVFRRTLPGVSWAYLEFRAPEDDIVADFYVRDHVDIASPYYMFVGMYEGLGTPAGVHEHWQGHAPARNPRDDQRGLQ